jgi:hypothetical protein
MAYRAFGIVHAHVHRPRVQINTTIESMLSLIESHLVTSRNEEAVEPVTREPT